jgi:hypothetical protein
VGELPREAGGDGESRAMAVENISIKAGDRPRMTFLKRLFWLYFLLLIFEGALRKWLLPQYSAPLLLIRDPVGILIILEAYRTNKWPEKWSLVTAILSAAMIGLCVIQVVANDNPWPAALYGLRSYLLPFPVAFVMGENLNADDLRRFAKWSLWLMLPETFLEILQYLAPSGSILNAGAYANAAQIMYESQHVRASGTFSFVIGPASFGPMVAVFVLYGLVQEKFVEKWLLWAAALAVILSMPVTGSREFVYEVAAVVAFAAIAAAFGASEFVKSLRIVVPLAFMFLLASFLPVFSESTHSFGERFSDANHQEGGSAAGSILQRTVAPFTNRLEETDFAKDPFGLGMGRGSAAVSTLLQGSAKFAAGESEIDRAIIELGPIPGIAFTLFRFVLALAILVKAFARARAGETLALLFAPLTFIGVALSVLEQPTEQGFMVILLAFTLAAMKRTAPKAMPASSQGSRRQVLRYSMGR